MFWHVTVRCRGRWMAALFLASVPLVWASQPWDKDAMHWTVEDARHILLDSPWSQEANATFGPELTPEDIPPAPLPGAAEAGIAGRHPNSGAGWDGGPGRDTGGRTPSLPVTVRWDSALPVRQAILKLPASDRTPGDVWTQRELERDYIVTVIGLVPAGRYRSAGQLQTNTKSSSDEDEEKGVNPQDPERLLEGVMAASGLIRRGQPPIRPEDVKLDASTGTLHLFFPRAAGIRAEDKDITFTTRFGSMRVSRKFRPKDMVYVGRLEL